MRRGWSGSGIGGFGSTAGNSGGGNKLLLARCPPHPAFQATFSPWGRRIDWRCETSPGFHPRREQAVETLRIARDETQASERSAVKPFSLRGEGSIGACETSPGFHPRREQAVETLRIVRDETQASERSAVKPFSPRGEGGLEGRMRGAARNQLL